MLRSIESSYNMNDILELIIDKVSSENQNIYQELKFFIDKPKLMTFFVLNNELQEVIRYYDPLYANAYLRNINPFNEITISVKLESNEDISRNDRDVIFKKSGYAKLRNQDGSFEWREAKIKEPDQRMRRDQEFGVKFKSFSNPCKIFF
jgi:hypothetical protein